MKFHARKTWHVGPFYVTVNQSGRRSYSFRLWRYTYSFTRKTSSFDTPGPGGFRHQHGRRGK